MRRTMPITLSLLTLACGGAGSDVGEGPLADVATQFGTLDCTSTSVDEDRSWCAVTHAGRGPITPPSDTKIRMGLTLAVHPGEDPKAAVLERTTLSALFVGAAGARLLDLKPTTDAEMSDLMGVVMSIASTLKCVPSSSVLVKKDLLDHLKGESTDLHTLTSDATSTVFQGLSTPAIIERIDDLPCGGPVYVVVETAKDGLIFVSVFPDSDLTVLPQ